MRKRTREIPEGPNLIPTSGMRLTDGYQRLLRGIENQNISLPIFDECWNEAFEKSLREEKKLHDAEVYDRVLEEFLLWGKQVNVFLRQQVEIGKLEACVQDPKTAEIYILPKHGWLTDWSDYVPTDIFSDFINHGSYESPGPEGTELSGALRPVFFMKQNFQDLLSTLERTPLNGVQTDNGLGKDHRVKLVAEIILEIWGGPPRGVPHKEVLRFINNELAKKRRPTVSKATVIRAISRVYAQASELI